jgi:hypothetical protein
LSHDAEVRVKWNVQRGWRGQPFLHLRVFVGGVVVDDGVDRLWRRHLRLYGIEEADELLMPVTVQVAANAGNR